MAAVLLLPLKLLHQGLHLRLWRCWEHKALEEIAAAAPSPTLVPPDLPCSDPAFFSSYEA